MKKKVIFRILEGDFERGFPVYLEIREDESAFNSIFETSGALPPALNINLAESLRHWQSNFKFLVERNYSGDSRNSSRIKSEGTIQFNNEPAQKLASAVNQWLDTDSEAWKKILKGIQLYLNPDDEIRIIIQTDNNELRRLPWSAWNLFSEDYENTEIALSAPTVKLPRVHPPDGQKSKVEILAVFGKSDNINIQFDSKVLESLGKRGAIVKPLNKPTKQELLQCLDESRWDIFFFAGHSSSLPDGKIGEFDINDSESLRIEELKNALKGAIAKGLNLAIFNSCDGLGLAYQMAELYLPQSIVMREVVPDGVAQKFLQDFLAAFSTNKSLYASMREARGKLEDAKNKEFPGINWLPIICQNVAVEPLTWLELGGEVWEARTTQTEQEERDRPVVSAAKTTQTEQPQGDRSTVPNVNISGVQEKGTWRCVHTLRGHKDSVRSVAIDRDSQIIASGSFDKTIKLWRLNTGELIDTLSGHSGTVTSVAFSPKEPILASAAAYPDDTIKLWNPGTGRLLSNLQDPSLIVMTVWSVAFSADGQKLVSSHNDNTIKLWHLSIGEKLRTFNGNLWPNCFRSVAISPDGRTLIGGSFDNTIKLWKLQTGEEIRTLNGSSGWFGSAQSWMKSANDGTGILAIAISPDGQIIASGSLDKTVKLWRLNDGTLRSTFTGHSDGVESVAISPDGQIIASGSRDKTIRIWNLQTERLLCVLTEHDDTVYSIAFSPDGQSLVSGSTDMTVKIWRVS